MYARCLAQTSSPRISNMTLSDCRYAPKYVKEYVSATNLGESLHLAEFWVDMRCDILSHFQQFAVRHVTV